MNKAKSNILSKLYQILTSKERERFKHVVFIVSIGSMLELLGLSLVIPLAKMYTNFHELLEDPNFYSIYKLTGSPGREVFFSYALILFVIYFFLKNSFLFFALYKQYDFVFKVRGDLSVRLYRKYLYMPWVHHLNRNSGQMINMIANEVNVFTGSVLLPTVVLIAEIIMAAVVFLFLLLYSPMVTLIVASVLISTITMLTLITKNRLKHLGIKRHYLEGMRIQQMQQGLSSVKELHVMNRQDAFLQQYSPFSIGSAEVVKKINLLQLLPRYSLEFSIVLAVAIVMMWFLSGSVGNDEMVPLLTIFIVASIRLLPSVTKIAGAFQSIRGGLQSFYKISDDFNSGEYEFSGDKSSNELAFESEIVFSNVSYAYPKSDKFSIDNLNFKIKKNECVGMKGKSGSGKSTLADLLLGVLEPTSGLISVDGKNINDCMQSWQRKIGFVPQSIYLLDDSIRNNIIFGDVDVDEDLLLKAVKDSHLDEFLHTLNFGLDEKVGERGVRLSGGQRQRIGIARALYRNPDFIIFDEATSALDMDTEQEITKTIEGLKAKKTIVIIAHRLSTLDVCDRVVHIKEGGLALHE
jgi:ABC-type multidrug transport system fused ATPase/permease subunit